jgi:hypothetical protein
MTSDCWLHNFIIKSYTYRRLKTVCKSQTGVHLGKFPVVRRTSFCTPCNSYHLNWTELLYYDRRSVGQSVLVSSPHLGLMTRFFNNVRHLRVCWYRAPSLTRGRVCLLQLLLSLPAQSFSGPSPAGLITTFYCLRFETPPTWRTRSLYLYPPGTGWPGYSPGTGLNSISVTLTDLFLLLIIWPWIFVIQPRVGPNRKHRFHRYSPKMLHCCLHIRCRGNLYIESLPSNELLLWLSDAISRYKFSCEQIL